MRGNIGKENEWGRKKRERERERERERARETVLDKWR